MNSTEINKPKVIVVGAGWAGLGATYHLAKQGYDVTLLEASPYPGGLVAGWKTPGGRSVEAGIHGFWYPYQNIFSLVKELNLNPFTPWTRSAQYSPAGLEVESPIFQDLPYLPTPLGTFIYTQFKRLPLSDTCCRTGYANAYQHYPYFMQLLILIILIKLGGDMMP